MKQTIAQQLNIKEFPFTIKDKDGNTIYFETSDKLWSKTEYDSNENLIYYEGSNGYWERKEFDSNGNRTYWETSDGYLVDNRSKSTCEGKIVEVDGKKYQLKEVK
jgi:hypothetical protein